MKYYYLILFSFLISLPLFSQELKSNVSPLRCSDNGHETQNGTVFMTDVNATVDGDANTFYHSEWNGVKRVIDKKNPVILTYEFDGTHSISCIEYMPRQDVNIMTGSKQRNGIFTEFDIWIQTAGHKKLKFYKHFSWGNPDNEIQLIPLPQKLQKIKQIQFRISDGVCGFVSCAEMKFDECKDLSSVFGDSLCTALRDNVKQSDIESLPDSSLKALAQGLKDCNYDFNYRLASYDCYESPAYLAEMWKCPGTYYDAQPGVTGINIRRGKHFVAVEGIPEGQKVELRIISYFNGKENEKYGDNKFLHESGSQYNLSIKTISMENGVNEILYESDYPGLAYISYLSDSDCKGKSPVKVHFINGEVNGYITAQTPKDKAREMLTASPNGHMDLVGNKVHSVWTTQGLLNYCKGNDGENDGYADYINLLDSIVDWEHEVLGFKKYGLVPRNRTFAYVNYIYYFFRGALGVSFHHSQEYRVLDCQRLRQKDQDAVWGMSHEWGHLHQIKPYFCWTGMTEVTNNINSVYNVLRMGYTTSQIGNLKQALKASELFRNTEWKGKTSINRILAYSITSYLGLDEVPEVKKLFESMSDSVIQDIQGPRGLSAYELSQQNDLQSGDIGAFGRLYPYEIIFRYFTTARDDKDFWPDLMKNIRETEQNGDKYAMLASYQNLKIDDLSTISQKFPESYWVKNKVISQKFPNIVPYILNFIRQASLRSGYNLTPFFEKYGYLRQLALFFSEYKRPGFYYMTSGMYDEFVNDMDELVKDGHIKPLTPDMIKEMESVFN